MDEKVDNANNIESPAEEVPTPEDIAIDSNSNKLTEVDELFLAENDEPAN